MKIRMSRRIIALALAFVMVLGMLPSVAFARTAGKDGSAAMNEDYEAKKSLMPIGPSFSTYTLLEWTAESDPDAAYSRASIPLKEREGGFVVNPLANPEAKLMLCSLANSDHDHTSAQGTESFLSYSFNYWQYVDSFVYWSGSQEGIVVVPTGEFTDAAHTNGVPVVATLGFPWGSGTGYVQEVSDFCQKAADGSFPVADKLIEVMDYYGFDGYFFNQESYGCSQEIAERLDEMIHYMHAKRPNMLISWYDSMVKSGSVSYGDAVNEYNKHWMMDDANGVRGVDEFFMNYNWYNSKITSTISTMKSIDRSQFDAFAGLDVQQNCMDTYFNDEVLVDEDGLARISLALYCPNSTLGLSADGAQFHEVERTFYTNDKEDPRDYSVNLSTSAWAGMSRFFADKTPITSAPFVTDFNSGHGTGYFVDGVLMRDAEWSYQSNQDVMPTWTWIIDSTGTKLEGDYDFTDAYNGGNSIKFHGTLDGVNDILLYSTAIEVESGMTLALTAKGGLENASLVAYLDDGTAADYADCEQVVTALTAGDGWVETVVDLSAYAGRSLKAIGLKIEGNVSGYQINLGRITVLDKTRKGLNGPSEIVLDEIMYTDAYTAEARVQWTKVTGAASYEIYKVHGEEKTLIMETPATAFYIPTLKRAADETDVTIEIVPINRSGVRGTGTELTIDWLYTNDDSEEVVVQAFENVALNATVTGVSFENSGEPASKALDGTAANNSKWCATNYGSGWMSIDIGREVTVKRWRVEHAEYGGEANNMNTIDFALEYKDASGNWVEVKRIRDNHDAVTDVLLDTPVTAREWLLRVYDDGSSPWGGIRIYEWQMFETDAFPQTDVVPMHFASAVNNAGADDTFSLKYVPESVTVKVYNAAGEELGSALSDGTDVVITGLDFGTADAGRVFYTTTSNAAAESPKLSAPFEAEAAGKSAPAEDVAFVTYSHPGSSTSSNGSDIYTTLTVNGLSAGDVVFVYENGADADYTKASLPVAEGASSVSVNRVLVPRAGGTLTLRVKRVGCLLSDAYQVTTPAFGMPTASVKVFARNEAGESLTGVRFELRDAEGTVVAQFATTSDSGATATVALGSYYLYCTEAPEGYAIPAAQAVSLTIEGGLTELEIILTEAGEEPDPTDPTDPTDPPVVVDPSDDSRDIPVSVLTATAGDWQTGYEATEGPAELALDGDTGTIWHTDWYGTSRANHWIQFELSEDYNVDGLRYLPRQTGNTNGTITTYEILVSDDGENFDTIATGNWDNTREWKLASFPAEHVKFVRLVAVDAVTDNSYVFASAAEIRLTGEVYVEQVDPTNMALNAEIIAYNGNALSNESSGPAKLFDGGFTDESNHKWCEDGNNIWVAFDLGQAANVSSISVYHAGSNGEWMPDGASTNTEGYELYTLDTTKVDLDELLAMTFEERTTLLDDNANWVEVATVSGNTDDITSHELALADARIFKFNISDTDSTKWAPCVRVYELEVYAVPSGNAPVVSADKTALRAFYNEVRYEQERNYTPETWADFAAALAAAETVLADRKAKQADVDAALAALQEAYAALERVERNVQKIFHLDSGRKYFSKDWTIALLNELSAAGYTHLQLAFGNNGFRFLLDDMTIEANGTTYASDDIKAGIKIGNANYYDEGEIHALTEAEMDEIIAHAHSVGVDIIAHVNMPGHMNAILDAMEYVGISDARFYGYTESASSVDLNNEEALNFMFALVDKYAAYFGDAGCAYFHIGADEYANDAYSGNMGFPSMGATLYAKFAEFVNRNAEIVKSHGMTPRAWNDGIYYGSYTAEFASDIEITYWSSGWWGYNLAKASKFDELGHGLINTDGGFYYILGKDDVFTEGSASTHTPGAYEAAEGYDVTRFMDGSIIDEPVGGMFCVWSDYPAAETETEVAANIRLALRAMALRMGGESLDGIDTSVVEGGFNEDGTINGSGEQPHEHSFGDWTVTTAPTCTEKGIETRACECGETETREVAALGHTEEIVPAKEATCTEDGLTEGKKCAVCGETLVAQEVIPALGHSWKGVECERCDATRENPFVDVPNDSFCIDPVLWAVEEGITTGTSATTFDPNGKCARAIVVTFLWRAAGSPEPTTTENPFSDVKESDFYYKAVLWAVEEGITTGTSATTFSPTELCNRATVVTFLYRAMGSPEVSTTENPFSDVKVDSWYGPAVLWAVENGITNGMGDGTFGVGATCTRAQVVTFLYRTLVK